MPPPDYFPVGTRVVLKGLVKAPELNGQVGVVKSGLTAGRQNVLLESSETPVALKVSNLSFEGRTLDSLSIKELKAILLSRSHATDVGLNGLDKKDLVMKVQALKDSTPENLAQWISEAQVNNGTKAKLNTAAAAQKANVDPMQAANQLSNMNPEQLRQQARMMRTMDPDTIRRMNPQLAHMTNAQIQAAANQMDMLANNPSMMKMATDQMKNMSPEEIQRMQNQAQGGGAAPTPTMAPATQMPMPPTANSTSQAADMMANMTPEQLKQQADMFESMSPDAIRQMNPQVAHMTDDQIQMAATQFRMMADNPEMMKMAMDQMKNLSPEEIEDIRNGKAPPTVDPMMGGDPSQIMANMDKKQLKSMLKTMKQNPEMLKQFAASSGMSEQQLAQGMEMFADMEDDKLDMALGMMQRVQKAKDVWSSANSMAGGHLTKILIVLGIVFILLLANYFFPSGSGSAVPKSSPIGNSQPIVDDIPNVGGAEDEFASEF